MTTKKYFYFFIGCLFFGLVSCTQKNSIEGNIKNLGNDTIFVFGETYSGHESAEEIQDTIFSVNSHFTYNPTVNESVILTFIAQKGIYKRFAGGNYFPESNNIVVFWKPSDKITIQGELNSYTTDYVIKGNEFNYDNSLTRKEYLANLTRYTDIEIALDSLMYSRSVELPTAEAIQQNDVKIHELFELRDKENINKRTSRINYVLNNPQKELSGFFMAQLPMDSVAKYYDTLDASVKNGLFAPIMERTLKRYNDYQTIQKNKEQIQAGKPAPDFTLQSLAGKPLALYSIEKEFIVLDFWGSWCGWCIKGFPKMKDYYQKYKNRLEILGIACRDTEEKWKKSIEDNQLGWLHVINDEVNNVPVEYAIEGYPTKIILDRDKKIVAVFLGESDEFYQKLDKLLK